MIARAPASPRPPSLSYKPTSLTSFASSPPSPPPALPRPLTLFFLLFFFTLYFKGTKREKKREKPMAAKQQLHLQTRRHYNGAAAALPRQHTGR